MKTKRNRKELFNMNMGAVESESWQSQAKTDLVYMELEEMTEQLLTSNQKLIDHYSELARSF